jgi:hypothetical protein
MPREKEDTGIMNMITKNLDMIAAERKAEQTTRDKKANQGYESAHREMH